MPLFLQDVRYAVRTAFARRHRLVTVLAIATLAIGIGASAAVFSVFDTLLIRPLPYPESDRIAVLTETSSTGNGALGQGADDGVSLPNFQDWVKRNRSFEKLGSYRFDLFNLSGAEGPEAILGGRLSPEVFTILGLETGPHQIRPARGRVFGPGTERQRLAVVSYDLWKRRFALRESLLGDRLMVNGEPYTVVAILPPEFEFPSTVPSGANVGTRTLQFFTPFQEIQSPDCRGCRNIFALGQLKRGVSAEAAQQDMARVARELAAEFPKDDGKQAIRVTNLQEHTSGRLRPALVLFLAAMGCVLLITCVNVANLLLARGASRGRELSVRIALGASRGRLILQLLLESLVLGVVGGGFGLLCAQWGLNLLMRLAPVSLDRIGAVHLDLRVILFAALLSLVTSVLFGILPALQLSASVPSVALNETSRGGSAGRRATRVRQTLVGAEMALSVVLVIGAGLLIRSYATVRSQDAGFDIDHTLSFYLLLPHTRYPTDSSQRAFFRTAIQRIEQVPGVTSAAVISVPPLSSMGNSGSVVPEGVEVNGESEWPEAVFRQISPEYFNTMSIRLRAGRNFTLADTGSVASVAIMNEGLARRLFPGADPLGRRVKVWGKTRQVVGVVRDVREFGLDVASPIAIYVPSDQETTDGGGMVVRTRSDPSTAIATVRGALASIDPDLPLLGARSLQETLGDSLAERRFSMSLLVAFAAIALALAAIGLYGVLAYIVESRTREIGLRMALGAAPSRLVGSVVGDGIKLAALGLGVGLIGALALSRLLGGLLYGVSPLDPLVYITIPILLLGVAGLATLIPAVRASRVDPTEALRAE